jgi:outer membrane protein TolC
MLRVARTIAALTLALAPVESHAREVWDLARWEQEAMARSAALTEAREETALAKARALEAAWARFPTLRWQSSVVPIPALTGDVLRTTTPTNDFVGFGGAFHQHRVDAWLPLFTFGRIRSHVRAQRAAADAATASHARAQQLLRFEVRRAYDSAKAAMALVEVLDEAKKRVAAIDRKLEELLESGASQDVEELDKNRLATFLVEIGIQRTEAERLGALSRDSLRAATSLGEANVGEIDPAPLALRPPRMEHADALIAAAILRRPDIQALAAAAESKRAMLANARAEYLPDFFATGTLGVHRCNVCTDQKNPFVFDYLNIDLWSASVGVRLTLDYGMKIARARQAEAEHQKASAALARASLAARSEIREAWHRHKQATAHLAITQKGRAAAEEWTSQLTRDFLAGKGRVPDVAEALAAWLKLRQEEARATLGVNETGGALELAAGLDGRPAP